LANFQLKSSVVMEEKGSGVVEDYRFWHERRTTKLERAREVEEEREQVRETLRAIINAQEAKAKPDTMSASSEDIRQYPAKHPDEETDSTSRFQSDALSDMT
jgi:hypothetical protein